MRNKPLNLTEINIKHIEKTLGTSIDGVSVQSLPPATLAELETINSLVAAGVILATDVGIVDVHGKKSIRISLEGIDKLLTFDSQFDKTTNEYEPLLSVKRTGVLKA